MNNWILFCWFLILFTLFYLTYHRRIGPSSIFILSLMVPLFVVLINDSYFMYEIGIESIIIITIVLVLFHSFSLIPLYYKKYKKEKRIKDVVYKVVIPKKWILIAYLIVSTNLIIKYKYIMAVGAEYGASNLISAYAATRLMLIDYANTGVADVRLPYYAIIIGLLSGCTEILCIHMALYKKIILREFDKRLWGIVIISVAALFLETGRAAFFPVIVHTVYLIIVFLDISRSIGTFVSKHLLKIASIISVGIFLFLVMGSLRQDKEGSGEIELSASNTLATYVGAPIIGLDIYIKRGIEQNDYWGEHTFREYYDWARIFGVPYKRSQFHKDDFYAGKGSSNVYTGLYYWLGDFNIWGTFIYAIFLGFIFGNIYSRKPDYGNIWECYLKSFFYFCLIMMFFDDQFNNIWSVNMVLRLSVIYYFQKKFFKMTLK